MDISPLFSEYRGVLQVSRQVSCKEHNINNSTSQAGEIHNKGRGVKIVDVLHTVRSVMTYTFH